MKWIKRYNESTEIKATDETKQNPLAYHKNCWRVNFFIGIKAPLNINSQIQRNKH